MVGEAIPIELVNVDDHDHAFSLPGASNGCGAFAFRVTFRGHGTTYKEDRSAIGCSQAYVPPRWLVIAKGESMKWEHESSSPVLAGSEQPPPLGKKQRTLQAGKYTLTVSGANISVSAPITLRSK